MADDMAPDPDSIHPFIDKIVVSAPVTDPALAQAFHSSTFTAFNDTSIFTNGRALAGYRVGKRIELADIKKPTKRPLFNYHYTKTPAGPGLATRYRIEFSPVDFSSSAMSELHAILTTCVNGGWEYFVKHGTINSIEVSVDLPGVRMESFYILTENATSMKMLSKSGKLETVYLGSKRGNQYRVYDRGNKRKAKGQPWIFPKTTRIERILRNQKIPLKELAALDNPFKAISLVTLPAEQPPEEPSERNWQMFCDSVSVRKLPAALQLLAEKKRAKYRSWLQKNGEVWWQPELFWSKWPTVTAESKIADLTAWK